MRVVTVRDFRDRASEMFRSDDVILVTREGRPAGFFLPWDAPELPADVRREVFLRTGRIGPDVVVDATGVPGLASLAVSSVRRGGRVVLAGVGHGSVEFELGQLVFYERTVLGSLGYNFDIPRVIDLMSTGRLDASPLITGRFPLSAGVGAFEDLAADRARHLKVLITPKGL